MKLRYYISIGILWSCLVGQAQIKGIPPHIVPLAADSYEKAKPWVVWYFMHASYSKEGITADLKAMAENNIAGAYFTPIKAKTDPPLFEPAAETLTPEWWEMFRHLVAEAKKYGIQIAMFPNDGFATAGGPWITPETSMQKVVYADTIITVNRGGKVNIRLPQPEKLYNYYEDIQLFAIPVAHQYRRSDEESPKVTSSYGEDVQRLAEKGNKERFATSQPGWIQYAFEEPFPSNALKVERRANNYGADRLKILVSDDGVNFDELTQLKSPRTGWLDWDNGVTHTIPYTTAKYYRFVFDPTNFEPGAEDLDAAKWKPSINIVGITLYEEPRVHQYEGKTGEIWRVSLPTNKEDVHSAYVIDSKETITLNPTAIHGEELKAELPAGTWKILRIGHTTTGHQNETAGAGKGLECDKLNAETVAFQFEQWFGKAYEMVGRELAKDVLTVYHIDSWESSSQNWTKRMPEEFKTRRGYDLTPYLPILAGHIVNSVEKSEAFLHDFRETIAELLQEEGYQTLRKKSDEYGVEFTAEMTAPIMLSDGMEHFGWTDRPMGEFWFRSPSHDKPNDILDAISGGHIYGKNSIMAEAFTQIRMEWDEHPRLLKSLQDRNFALGINSLVYHVYVHNPWMDRKPGMTLDGIGLYFQRDQIWWKPGKAWVDYAIRAQQLLQTGKPVRDIAVFIGEEMPRRSLLPDRLTKTFPGIIGQSRVERTDSLMRNEGWPTQRIASVTTSANMYNPADWVDPLRGYAYDSFNPDVLLHQAKVVDGNVVFADHIAYRLLVVPGQHLLNPTPNHFSLAVLQKFADLVEQGASLLFKEKPTHIHGIATKQDSIAFQKIVDKLFSDMQMADGLQYKSLGKGKVYLGVYHADSFVPLGINEDVIIDNKNNTSISWNHRHFDGGDSYFVANQDSVQREASFSFRTTAPYVYLYDVLEDRLLPVSSVQKDNRTELRISFEPFQSFFVLFSEGQLDLPDWKVAKVETLKGEWDLQLTDVKHESIKQQHPDFWTTSAVDDVRYHSGMGSYSLTFDQPKKIGKQRVTLKLERVESLAEIVLNGREVGVIWTNPLEIDVTDYLTRGKNKLEVRVYNTWGNRFGYESRHEPAEKLIQTIATPKYLKDLQESGLQGDVQLIWYHKK
ncbi:glycosyl hydrolase [Sphingobacterium corticibacterium]|uniref:DNA-binding protein n=1 Tax=Sphingobacterium corticibacterium TaxID=2484746 RepID=A0A4Q6XIK9_9SPHI|nr:glycosyl hydrolase [Sphingobacterium corticibacterium]RZF59840.1 DNA-binding protein [Sphingobacterium corticibacterium]